MLTYERTDDYVLTLSDAGQQRLADEQRAQAQTEIRLWSIAGAVVIAAGLVIKHILGA